MKVSFSSNFGRFDYTLTTALPEGTDGLVVNLVANEGLANLGFRAVGANVEKALVKAGAMGKDDKRNAAEYSVDNAEVVRQAAQDKLDEVCGDAKTPYPSVQIKVTGEHVFGETEVSRKMATELLAKADAAVLLALGIKSDMSDAEKVEIAHEFLAGLRSKKAKKA